MPNKGRAKLCKCGSIPSAAGQYPESNGAQECEQMQLRICCRNVEFKDKVEQIVAGEAYRVEALRKDEQYSLGDSELTKEIPAKSLGGQPNLNRSLALTAIQSSRLMVSIRLFICIRDPRFSSGCRPQARISF